MGRKITRKTFAVVAVLLIGLNFSTFVAAYPETFVINSGCCAPGQLLAKDFSAYYTGAWRLLHNPSEIYVRGFVDDGEYRILPQPEQYKYLPSFLLFVVPLLLLPYQSALITFDSFQFLLLPLMALLVYELVKEKGLLTTVPVAVVTLLLPLPLPTPQWSISISYYWQWAEGQSKVLETFFLLLTLCLARAGRPRLSGIIFAFASFDPRFALLALPLFITYNTRLRLSSLYALGTLLLVNLPLLHPATGRGFIGMVVSSGALTPPYYYNLIPILALVSLIVIDRQEIGIAFKRLVARAQRTRHNRAWRSMWCRG